MKILQILAKNLLAQHAPLRYNQTGSHSPLCRSEAFLSSRYSQNEVPVYEFECRPCDPVRWRPPNHASFHLHAVLHQGQRSEVLDCCLGQSLILAPEFVCGFPHGRHPTSLLLVLLLRRISLRTTLYRRLPQPGLWHIVHERPGLPSHSSVSDSGYIAARI